MGLAYCPHCSGYRHDAEQWFARRPQVSRGRHSGKFLFHGCCAFSDACSHDVFETEAEAEAAWDALRDRAARESVHVGAMVAALDALDSRGDRPAAPVAAPVVRQEIAANIQPTLF